jgi:hypothetical protein
VIEAIGLMTGKDLLLPEKALFRTIQETLMISAEKKSPRSGSLSPTGAKRKCRKTASGEKAIVLLAFMDLLGRFSDPRYLFLNFFIWLSTILKKPVSVTVSDTPEG